MSDEQQQQRAGFTATFGSRRFGSLGRDQGDLEGTPGTYWRGLCGFSLDALNDRDLDPSLFGDLKDALALELQPRPGRPL